MTCVKCPIWDTPAIEHPNHGDGHFIDSSRAGGKYLVAGTAAAMLEGCDDLVKARLTSWLIEQRQLSIEWPEIYSTTISEAQQRQDLRAPERADGILRYLKEKSKILGTIVRYSVFMDLYDKSFMTPTEQEKEYLCLLAHSECINMDALNVLMDYLEDEGLIKNISRDDKVKGCNLTVEGCVRVDELNKLDAPVDRGEAPAWERCPAISSTAASATCEIAAMVPGRFRAWWKWIVGALGVAVAVSTLWVNFQVIKVWFTTDSRPVETTGGTIGQGTGPRPRLDERARKPARAELPLQAVRPAPRQTLERADRHPPNPNKDADDQAASERPQDAVLIGNSRAELRERNGLRRMLDIEDGQVLSRLIGVYGFVSHLSLAHRFKSTDGPHLELDLSSLRLGREHSTAREVELHALGEGRPMVLVNVSRGDAARLSDPTGDVGEIFGFFFDGNEDRAVLVGIPVSRVGTWQSRTQEFAAIDVN